MRTRKHEKVAVGQQARPTEPGRDVACVNTLGHYLFHLKFTAAANLREFFDRKAVWYLLGYRPRDYFPAVLMFVLVVVVSTCRKRACLRRMRNSPHERVVDFRVWTRDALWCIRSIVDSVRYPRIALAVCCVLWRYD